MAIMIRRTLSGHPVYACLKFAISEVMMNAI